MSFCMFSTDKHTEYTYYWFEACWKRASRNYETRTPDTQEYRQWNLFVYKSLYASCLEQLMVCNRIKKYNHVNPHGVVYTNAPLFNCLNYATGFKGKLRSIPAEAYMKIKNACSMVKTLWDSNAFTLDHSKETAYVLTNLCKLVQNDMVSVIRLVRNQSDVDSRPNKHLGPYLYQHFHRIHYTDHWFYPSSTSVRKPQLCNRKGLVLDERSSWTKQLPSWILV